MKPKYNIDKKRVVFLFGHLHKGGMQKAASNISCALPSNIEQYIVFFGTENPGFEYQGTMVDLNIPGELKLNLFTTFTKLSNFYKRITQLQNFLDENKIETVVSFGEIANIINILTKRKKSVLSVRVSIDESLSGIYGYIYKKLIAFLYKRAPIVTTVSEKLAEQLSLRYAVPKSKIRVIYNLYNIEKIKVLSNEELDIKFSRIFEKPTIINVGSLCYQKGQEHLIRAFALAKQFIPDLQLIVIGRGELQEVLKSLAEELSIFNSVHFFGFQKNSYKFLSKSDIFVLTSRFEGFPNALVEAMICGLPVISTNCNTGPSEILGDSEYGVLLPDFTEENIRNVEQLAADWMVKLLEPNLNQSYRNKALARSYEFNQEKIIPSWLEVF